MFVKSDSSVGRIELVDDDEDDDDGDDDGSMLVGGCDMCDTSGGELRLPRRAMGGSCSLIGCLNRVREEDEDGERMHETLDWREE